MTFLRNNTRITFKIKEKNRKETPDKEIPRQFYIKQISFDLGKGSFKELKNVTMAAMKTALKEQFVVEPIYELKKKKKKL